MKRFISVLTALILTMGFTCSVAMADTAKTADVTVTISVEGSLKMTQEKVTVTDLNDDGKFDIDEALYAAHEEAYEGGAAAGYSSYTHEQYGLSLGMLWGNDSGCFGYRVNNASAWSLADEVKAGDQVVAYVYKDQTYWSDTYCWFDKTSVAAEAGESVVLTLNGAGYDADWNPVTVPVANAVITIDGKETSYKTDKNGKVTIKLSDAGSGVISAVSSAQILVPPVCMATVAPTPVEAVVAISDGTGKLVMVNETVTVKDIDNDYVLTINDALYAAHEVGYEGGAAAGYASYTHEQYGLSLGKLWGDTSGCFGYRVNNVSAWSLADEVKAGDYVKAYVYQDQTYWSDVYTWFDETAKTVNAGDTVTLTLNAAGYDANWAPITKPAANAVITIDGKTTEYVTDENGNVSIPFNEAGTYTISAVSEEQLLVPAACVVTVKQQSVEEEGVVNPDDETSENAPLEEESGSEDETQTGDDFNAGLYGVIALAALAAAGTACMRRRTEK